MTRQLRVYGMIVLVLLTASSVWAEGAALSVPPTPAPPAAGRTAQDILADIKAMPIPKMDMARVRTDSEYFTKTSKEQMSAMKTRAGLIAELYKASPDAAELNALLPERWRYLSMTQSGPALVDELTTYLDTHPDTALRPGAALTRLQAQLNAVAKDAAARRAAVEACEKACPKDARLSQVLDLAFNKAADKVEKQYYVDRLTKEFPDSRATKAVLGQLRAEESIGKPFELAFDDAVTGKKVSIAGLKGKVVVVDFWATWCGPCVAEMPHMKDLYAKFKDQGVEFIGVSLDQPGAGLDKLKEFVAKNEIAWPQYYQGHGWDSEFSTSWGINAIPAMFVVDADGHLANTAARGKLDQLLPDLLKKGKETAKP